MSLLGKKAPNFKASAVINGNSIVDDFSLESYAGQYVVLFFYPLDRLFFESVSDLTYFLNFWLSFVIPCPFWDPSVSKVFRSFQCLILQIQLMLLHHVFLPDHYTV